MTPVALSTGAAILAWATVAVALVGALAAVVLLTRVVRPALEIERYAEDIAATAGAIEANVRGAEELGRTRALATAVPGLVERVLSGPGAERP